MQMTHELLQCERRDKLAIVTLNRSEKRNALSTALRNEIDACLGELEGDDSVSVAVITGAGPVFCAGFDRSEFFQREPDQLKAFVQSTDRFHLRLISFAKPLVAGG